MKLIRFIILMLLLFINNLVAGRNTLSIQNKKSLSDDKHKKNNHDYSFLVERNYSNYRATIYLLSNKIKTDSLILHNLDFKTDSLIKCNDSTWHYLFSVCTYCDSLSTLKAQFIFIANNKKIKIAFISDYLHTSKFNFDVFPFKPVLDSNEYFNNIKKQFRFFNQISLDSNFFNGKITAEETIYSCKSGISKEEEGFKKEYPLKYDSQKKIYYNKKVVINDMCTFELEVNGKTIKKRLNNETILLLDFYKYGYAYYQGKWYGYFKNFFRPMDIIYYYCDIGGCNPD